MSFTPHMILSKINQFLSRQKKSGFTLLYAILTISVLIAVGISMLDIAIRELVISSSGRDSQFAFYAADSGIECALFWDLRASATSAFATSTPVSILCNGQSITTASQSVPTNPIVSSRIGGGGNANPTSIFYLNFNSGATPLPYCAIVTVTKTEDRTIPANAYILTKIESRGYNSCASGNLRRVERAIRVQY